MPQQCLTPERRVILQQIVDVPHPVVLFPRSRALSIAFGSVSEYLFAVVGDTGPVDAGDGEGGGLDGDALAGLEDLRDAAVHGDGGVGATVLADLRGG